MADHKIYGNNGAGNVQAPDRIWASNRTNGNCVVGFTSRSEEYSIEYIRADVAASQLAAANARADAARDDALVEAAARVRTHSDVARKMLGKATCEEHAQTWSAIVSHIDIDESAILALRDKPAPAVTVQDSFSGLIADARTEAEKAMKKFPQPNYVLLKVAEEAGEVVKAGVHFAEGRETRENVKSEMIQAIAMLYRLWVEGDQVNGVPPIAPQEA